MFTVKEALITEYEKTLLGKIPAISPTFFDNCTPLQKEKYATILIEYAFTNLLQMTPEQALTAVDKEMLTKLKLMPFLRYIRFPYNLPDDAYFYIAFLCYPTKFLDKREKLVLYIYEKSLTKEDRLPANFFEGEEGKEKTAIAFKYQLPYLGETIPDLYKIFSNNNNGKKYLRKYKLHNAVGNCFKNSLDMLHYCLPSYLKSDFWYNYYIFKDEYKKKKRELKKTKQKKD